MIYIMNSGGPEDHVKRRASLKNALWESNEGLPFVIPGLDRRLYLGV